MCKCVQVCSKLIVIVGDMRVKSAESGCEKKRGEQSRSEERKITIGNKSRRAGTGGRCMDFLRAILCANSKRDDNQRLLLLIMTVGRYGKGEAAGSQAGDCR